MAPRPKKTRYDIDRGLAPCCPLTYTRLLLIEGGGAYKSELTMDPKATYPHYICTPCLGLATMFTLHVLVLATMFTHHILGLATINTFTRRVLVLISTFTHHIFGSDYAYVCAPYFGSDCYLSLVLITVFTHHSWFLSLLYVHTPYSRWC